MRAPKFYNAVVSLNFPGKIDPPGGPETVYKPSRTDLANIIMAEHIYERERTRRPLNYVIDEMSKRLTIETNGPSFSIAFDDTDPHAAQRVVIDIFALLAGRWSATYDVRISNVRPDPTPRAPVRYRREAGRGLIVAGLSAFLLMFGALDFWQRRGLRKA